MSWLSQATGVHISPHGAHLSTPDPLGAAKSALSNPLFDTALALGLPGVGSAITGALGAIPGVGGALAGGAGAIGGALSHIPGASALGIGGGGAASAIPDAAMGIPGAASAGGGGVLGSLEGLAGKAGGFLTGNGGKNALGIAQGVNAALQQKQSNDYAKQALGSVEASYNQRAPLRAQGLSLMQQAGTGNPYATGTPNGPLRIGG